MFIPPWISRAVFHNGRNKMAVDVAAAALYTITLTNDGYASNTLSGDWWWQTETQTDEVE